MNPTTIFGIVVRTVGLILFVVSAICIFPGFLSLIMGGPPALLGLLVYGLPVFFLGLWLLRGAPSLVEFAYPDESKEQKSIADPTWTAKPATSRES